MSFEVPASDRPDAREGGFFVRRLGFGPRVLQRAAGTFVVRGFAAALALVCQLSVAKLVSQDDFGLFGLALTSSYALSLALPLGFNRASLRFIPQYAASGDHARMRGFIRYGLAAAFIAAATSSVLSAFVGAKLWAAGDRSFVVAVFLALSLPFSTGLMTLDGIARGLGKIEAATIPLLLLRWAFFALALAVIWIGNAPLTIERLLFAVAASIGLAFLVQAAWLFAGARGALIGGNALYEPRSWWPVAASQFGASSIAVLRESLDVIALSALTDARTVAIYYVALRMIYPISFIRYAVMSVSGHAISTSHHNGSRRESLATTRGLTWTMLAAAAAAFAALALVAPTFLRFLGADYAGASSMFLTLGLGAMIEASYGPAQDLLEISGFHRLSLGCEIATLAIVVVALAVLIPIGGATGAAVSMLIGHAVCAVFIAMAVRTRFGAWHFFVRDRARERKRLAETSCGVQRR